MFGKYHLETNIVQRLSSSGYLFVNPDILQLEERSGYELYDSDDSIDLQ